MPSTPLPPPRKFRPPWPGIGAAAVASLLSACADVIRPAPPAAVEFDPPGLRLEAVGDTARVRATVRDPFGNILGEVGLDWHSGDEGVATVDGSGLVTARGSGTSWLRASVGEVSDSVSVQVDGPLMLRGVSPDSETAVVGSLLTLRVRVEDGAGNPRPGVPVRWRVDSGSLATPPETVSGESGEAVARWTLGPVASVQTATATVEGAGEPRPVVFERHAGAGPLAAATLAADSILLSGPGEEVRLTPALRDSFGNPGPTGETGLLSWTTDDDGVVDVDPGGLVTAVGEGVATVRARVSGTVTDSIRIEVAPRGAITLTFDDGWRSVYENAWPVIRDFPWLRANVGVYTEAVGWPGFLTQGQLDELHAAGWSMVSHTVSHDSLSILDPMQLEAELRDSQAWLEARGYRGTDILIAPYHDFDEDARVAASRWYRASRGASAHATSPETLAPWMPDAPHRLTGIPADDLPYTTEEGRDRLRALLLRTADEGAFLDVFLHEVPDENVAAFRALVEILGEFRDRVLPYHELFPPEARLVR